MTATDNMADLEYARIQGRKAAQLRVAAEDALALPFPKVRNLADVLAEPDPERRYLVDQLWPANGTLAILAQAKAGKTRLTHNLARSLVDGDPLFGWFGVASPTGHVSIIDTELDEDLARRWLREQSIAHPDRVRLVSAKGAAGTLDFRADAVRARWATELAGSSVIILDCVSPVMAALGIDADKDNPRVRAYLESFDQLKIESGATEAAYVHHMGHSGEHGRGASAFEDHPTAWWKLLLGDTSGRKGARVDDLSGARYLKAFGRDVDQPESRVEFDAGRLTWAGGSRAQNRVSDLDVAIVEYVRDNPGATKGQIAAAVTGTDAMVARRVDDLWDRGRIRRESGPRGAQLHWPIADYPR